MKKIVVVTGAASGIGQAIARRAARDGHIIIAVDIQEPDDTIEIILNNGGKAVPFLCDLRDSKSVEGLFAWVRKTYGGVDVLVNIASELAFVAAEGAAVYCASKAAVVHLTRALAVEEAKYGIRINSVCPGPVDTGMLKPTFGTAPDDVESEILAATTSTVLQRLGTPKEIAEVVWFAASEGASFMVGSALIVDGGATAV
jgi:NAD(P)-dependent dehydrogenase (short-subunit alcohol dehydrogenase family)